MRELLSSKPAHCSRERLHLSSKTAPVQTAGEDNMEQRQQVPLLQRYIDMKGHMENYLPTVTI
jgi:hypothetical protein